MASTNFDVIVGFIDNASSGLNNLKQGLDSIQSNLKQHEATYKKMALAGTAAFTAIAGFGALTVKAAADAEVAWAGMDTTFQGSSGAAREMIARIRQDMPIATREIAKKTTMLGGMARGMGFAEDEALGLTEQVLSATAAQAAFRGEDPSQTLQAMMSMMSGSTQAAQRYGINIRAAAVEQTALEMGLISSTDELNKMDAVMKEQILTQARLQAITNGSVAAFDSLEKEKQTLSFRLRDLRARVEELREEIGKALMPIFTRLVDTIEPIIEKMQIWAAENLKLIDTIFKLSLVLAGLTAAVGFLSIGIITLTAAKVALMAAMTPILPIIAGISIAVGALYIAYRNNFFGIRDIVNSFATAFGSYMQAVAGTINMLWEMAKWVFNALGEAFTGSGDVFGRVVARIVNLTRHLANAWFAVTQIIVGLINGDLHQAWASMPEVVRHSFYTALVIVEDFVNGFIIAKNWFGKAIEDMSMGMVSLRQTSKKTFAEDMIMDYETLVHTAEDTTLKMTDNFDDLMDGFDDFSASAGESLSGTGKSMEDLGKKFEQEIENIDKDLNGLVDKIDNIQKQIADVQSKFLEQEERDRERIAKAIVDQEEKIGDLRKKQRDLKKQLNKEENSDRARSIRDELDLVSGQLTTEEEVREQFVDRIKEFEQEVTELKRWNSLSALEQAFETYDRERQAAQEAYDEKIALLNAELTEVHAQAEAIIAQAQATTGSLKSQYVQNTDNFVAELNRQIQAAQMAGAQIRAALAGGGSTRVSVGGVQRRAKGGNVNAGQPYIVGEEGHELFVPNRSGTIIPNHKLGSSGQTIVVNIGNVFGDRVQFERMVDDVLVKKLKMNLNLQ